MVATVMETGGDFDSLSGWEASLQTDLVGSQTLAFSGTLTGSLTDGASVKGATSGATATVVHANEAGDQILLENISGNFESGEKIFLNAPSTAVLDNFNRSNEGPPPSANWSRGYMNLLGQWEVSGNQATVDSLTNGAAHNYWNVGTFGDSEVHAKITTLPTSGSVGMTLRMVDLGGLTPDGYILGIDSDGCAIRRYDDGTSSVLASFGFAVSAGDSFGLSAVGSTLTAYYKSGAGEWTALGSVTDDTYSTAGYISLATDNADVVVDDFGGGTVPNYFTPSDAGNPAIAVAKIDGAWTGADDTAVVIDGWETGPTNYVKIYTTATARHAGVWDDTKYRLSTSEYGSSLRILNTNDVEIDGLQIENTRTGSEDGSAAGINFRDNFNLNLNVSDCIIRKNGIYTPSYIYYSGGISGYDYRNLEIYNNIIYDFIMGVSFHYPANNAKLYLYNNTIKDFGASGNGVGLTEYSSGITFRLKNNLLDGAGDNYNIDTSGDTTEYLNNISSDATSPNSGATDCGGHSCRNQTVTFLNEAGDDFHLSGSDTAAKDAGTDLSADSYLPFTTDIDGDTRPINDTWDIGADETDLVPEEPSVRTEGTKIKGGVKINGGVKFN
jgi:hypothetical protein